MTSKAPEHPPGLPEAPQPPPQPHPDLSQAQLVFADVYRQNAPFIWRALRRLGVREADVEDVAQELFVLVHRRLSDYDGTSTVRTWLFGIAYRMASDYRRRAYVRREAATEVPPDPGAPATQTEALERRRARQRLDELLDTLDQEKRAVFVLYELEQLPMSEVAAAVACPLQTAYSRLHAARKQVEATLHRWRLQEERG